MTTSDMSRHLLRIPLLGLVCTYNFEQPYVDVSENEHEFEFEPFTFYEALDGGNHPDQH